MKKHLIVESEFLDNLFITQEDNKIRADLYNFITQDFSNYELICDFEDFEEYKAAMIENPVWEIMLDRFNTVEYNENVEIESICKNPEKYSHSIFLLDDNAKDIDQLTDKFGLIFINEERLENIWSGFADLRKGVQLKVTKSNIIPEEYKLDCWSKIEKFSTPLNSVIIFDRYILDDKTNQKMDHNILPFLEYLIKDRNPSKPIDITIITELNAICNIQEKHRQITEYLNKKDISYFNLNIVKHAKMFYPRDFEGLHSRFILTNYFHFKCDDSFNFFKRNGKVNNDADLRINFNLNEKNDSFFKKELIDVKTYFEKIENNSSQPVPECREMFYPSKTNPLLV
jgi:hypothetical protein